jgi:hypothetical protein
MSTMLNTFDKELIKKINDKCAKECECGQGIFFQPFGIPDGIQEYVIYSSYVSGGICGGSCWESSNPRPFTEEMPKDHMAVLDILLTEIAPNINFLQYKKIQRLINSNKTSQWEYYGNSTDHVIEYILVSELVKLLNEIELNNDIKP